jgi:hypothetical protein
MAGAANKLAVEAGDYSPFSTAGLIASWNGRLRGADHSKPAIFSRGTACRAPHIGGPVLKAPIVMALCALHYKMMTKLL